MSVSELLICAAPVKFSQQIIIYKPKIVLFFSNRLNLCKVCQQTV